MNQKMFFIKVSESVKMYDAMKNVYEGGIIPVVHMIVPKKANPQGQAWQGQGYVNTQTWQGFKGSASFTIPVNVYRSMEVLQRDASECFVPRISLKDAPIRQIDIDSESMENFSDAEFERVTLEAFEKEFGEGNVEMVEV